jgi:hypothetical protein
MLYFFWTIALCAERTRMLSQEALDAINEAYEIYIEGLANAVSCAWKEERRNGGKRRFNTVMREVLCDQNIYPRGDSKDTYSAVARMLSKRRRGQQSIESEQPRLATPPPMEEVSETLFDHLPPPPTRYGHR